MNLPVRYSNKQFLLLLGESSFHLAVGICSLASCSLLFCILYSMFYGGYSQLSFEFISTPSTGATGKGGVLYQIIGTLILMSAAVLITAPAALSLALTQTTILKNKSIKGYFLTFLHTLNATPSIILGIIGFIVFFKLLGWHKSWLAGGLILAFMILPTVAIATIQRIQTIPVGYIETAQGLGFDEERLIKHIIIPYSLGGLLTGLVMGAARAAGETAPIMFTAAVFFGPSIPTGITDSPVLALPYHIFNLAQDVFGESAIQNAWATSIVLVGCVLAFTALAIPMRMRAHEEAKV